MKIYTLLCFILLSCIHFSLQAQCPVDQSKVTINIFGPDNVGNFSGENSWELIDLTTGTVLLSENCGGGFAGGTGALPFSISTCVPNGTNIGFRAYDTFGDGWCDVFTGDPTTTTNLSVQIDYTEDGSGGSCRNIGPVLAPTLVQNADFTQANAETPVSCLGGTNEELVFDFVAPECVDPIPTMSEWGLMIFALLTMNLGLIILRRKEEMFDIG